MSYYPEMCSGVLCADEKLDPHLGRVKLLSVLNGKNYTAADSELIAAKLC